MALRKRHILLIVALLLAFIGMATAAISILNGNVISPSESLDIDAYKISGIDVSAHNGNIDFAKARAAGTEFVFVKATEGATFRDSAMNSNLRKAHEAGLKTGVYHFFRFDVDGVKQAHNLLKAIAGRPLSLPLVIDVESHTNPYTPADIVTRKIHDMVDELTAYGYPVIIYSNKKGFDNHVRDEFADCGVWLCSFTQPNRGKNWTFWQYSHKGSIPGIDSDVDLDPWHGTASEWQQYTAKTEKAISVANMLYATINANRLR